MPFPEDDHFSDAQIVDLLENTGREISVAMLSDISGTPLETLEDIEALVSRLGYSLDPMYAEAYRLLPDMTHAGQLKLERLA